MLLSGCSDVRTASESSFLRSDYYTRGIGVYPGCPQEDFSPVLLPDNHYRNLALLRATYQSSAYDYNLTSQLLTDGIVTDQSPPILRPPDSRRQCPQARTGVDDRRRPLFAQHSAR